jgi:intracellular sulfur oxidation DsrE/DsrF family protein
MKKEDIISEEQLNAFTDGELDTEEESHIFRLCDESPELDARLCQQRKLKEMVQHAYRNVPQARRPSAHSGSRGRVFGIAAAAMLLLVTGLAVGWFASLAMAPGHNAGQMAGVTNVAAQTQSDTYLLHVTTSDPERMQKALRRADELMNGPDATETRRVEIVANESGLDLLRSDVTPFAAQIRALAEQDVLFFACTRAIERLEAQGIHVRLVPEANTEYSALDRVVLRMQQGWEYVKI